MIGFDMTPSNFVRSSLPNHMPGKATSEFSDNQWMSNTPVNLDSHSNMDIWCALRIGTNANKRHNFTQEINKQFMLTLYCMHVSKVPTLWSRIDIKLSTKTLTLNSMKGSHIWILQFVVEICHKFDTSTICNLDKYSQAEVVVAQQCGMNVSQLWAKVGADWDK